VGERGAGAYRESSVLCPPPFLLCLELEGVTGVLSPFPLLHEVSKTTRISSTCPV
jgi:hypothetical protein